MIGSCYVEAIASMSITAIPALKDCLRPGLITPAIGTEVVFPGNGLAIEGTAFGIAENGKSTSASYASVFISDLLQLRFPDFLDR